MEFAEIDLIHYRKTREVEKEKGKAEKSNINNTLPQEILDLVFRCRPPIEAARTLRNVCHHWRSIVDQQDLEGDPEVATFRALMKMAHNKKGDTSEALSLICRAAEQNRFTIKDRPLTRVEQCFLGIDPLINSPMTFEQDDMGFLTTAKEIEALQKASKKGHALANFILGVSYSLNGKNDIARKHLKKSQKAGCIEASAFLQFVPPKIAIGNGAMTLMYYQLQGFKSRIVGPDQTLKRTNKTAQEGSLLANQIIYNDFYEGDEEEGAEGVKQSASLRVLSEGQIPYFQVKEAETFLEKGEPKKALSLLLEAKNNPKAQFILGRLYAQDLSDLGTDKSPSALTQLKKEDPSSVDLKWFDNMREKGEEAPHFQIGFISVELETEESKNELTAYEQALNGSQLGLLRVISEMYASGHVLDKDDIKAKYFAELVALQESLVKQEVDSDSY